MVILLLIAIALLALAYREASATVWSGVLPAVPVVLLVTGVIGTAGLLVGLALTLPVSLLLLAPSVRRTVLTGRLFSLFKRVLPPMSRTERDALEAGDTWWEGELFKGRPDWSQLHDMPVGELSEREQSFIDNETERFCRLLDQDRMERSDHDMTPEAWDFALKNGFFSFIIPEQYGGLHFSAYAQSCIVSKIASRSFSAAVTVMVPNSLGPGELLMQYGTDEQKDHWLPRLADGREIPCFALTGTEAGSDAAAMQDVGIVCEQEYQGRKTLGIRLSFDKRYITLSPVATVLGLAFKMHDPDQLLGEQKEYGITCALVPTSHEGIRVGRRHFPMALSFMNGPVQGQDVFIPLDWIIGGPDMAGKGWRMLMECLSVGRGISLPALGTGAGKMAYRMTGAYARIRRQFRLPIGKFEGVQEAMARIGGHTYRIEAGRRLTAAAGDMGYRPSVVAAIAKFHMTEMMRVVVNDAMDVHGGRGIIFGPRNYLGYSYQSIPVGITVEGANILTRNLMIFGQGAIRCHPYVFAEMEAARADDLAEFDRLLTRHVGYSINRGVRAFVLGLTGARLATAPVSDDTARYYRQLERMSSALAFVSDVAMGVLGGELKRRERLSARLGDVLSELYLATAVLKMYHDAGRPQEQLPYVRWALDESLSRIYDAFDGFFRNFPRRLMAAGMRWLVFPLGRPYHAPEDADGQAIAESMMQSGGVRDQLTRFGSWSADDPNDCMGRMEHAMEVLDRMEPLYDRFLKLVAKREINGFTLQERLDSGVTQGLLTEDEARQLAEYDAIRLDCIVTDAFDKAELASGHGREAATEPVAGQVAQG
nr:acyl-CoA dehydrogenase [Methylonatrum kenyense]